MEVPVRITAIIVTMIILISIGVTSYMHLEKWVFEDALYFSIVTMSVGHGVVSPTQQATKIFTVFYVLSLGSVLLLFLTTIGNIYFSHGHSKIEEGVKHISGKIAHRRPSWKPNRIFLKKKGFYGNRTRGAPH